MAKSNTLSNESRFTDVLGEPTEQLLAPIKGYQDKPLVSLTQAIEPVAHFFKEIEDNVKVALHNCRNPPDGLSQDESAAIHLYTMEFDGGPSLYTVFNDSLRAEIRDNLKAWFSYLKLFMTALYKLPSEKKRVWRGIRGVDLSSKYKTGSKFAWWGVSSCTADIGVLQSEKFLGQHDQRTLFSIECIDGKSVVGHSHFEDAEAEVILKPGSYFEVIGQLNAGSGLHIIELQERIPPMTLIKPPFVGAEKKRLHNIPSNARWSSKKVVFDGLSDWPFGLAIDQQNGTIYVAETYNDRIVSWTPGEQQSRELVKNLGKPTNVLIDKENNSIIITDCYNRRVIRKSLQSDNTQIETIIDNIDCYGLAIDDEGALYVTNWKKDEVRRYPKGNKTGIIVAGGNGKGQGLHQLSYPKYVAVDSEGAVYVSENWNHRVVKWNREAKEGIVVAGFEGQGSKNTQLNFPRSVVIDANDNLYIADRYNHRVVRYRKNSKEADILIDSTQLRHPFALAFDRQCNLYVTCYNTKQLLRFSIVD